MSSVVESRPNRTEDAAVIAAVQAGDESAFTGLVDRYRRELQVHCYRMLGSFTDSEDLVQETFLRAWRGRGTFQGRSTFRAWLYRIATNACLDALARHPAERQAAPTDPDGRGASEVSWLQPYPDRLLEPVAPSDAEPDAALVARETIELAFLVAAAHLPPRQRAVLILRDVLGWPAAEVAALLEAGVASVNSALQRARATLRKHLPERRSEWAATDPTHEERAVLQRFVAATERGDMAALAALLREDALFTMPPEPTWYHGRAAVLACWEPCLVGPDAWGDWRLLSTRANRQPAVANYLRRPDDSEFRALALDVLRIEEGQIAEITTFGPELFAAFGLPPAL